MLRRSKPWEDKIEMEGTANAQFLRQEWGQHVLKKQKESHCGWNVVRKAKVVRDGVGEAARVPVTRASSRLS